MFGFRENFRFVFFNPQYLGGSKPGERNVAGDLDESLFAYFFVNFVALRLGALIIP